MENPATWNDAQRIIDQAFYTGYVVGYSTEKQDELGVDRVVGALIVANLISEEDSVLAAIILDGVATDFRASLRSGVCGLSFPTLAHNALVESQLLLVK